MEYLDAPLAAGHRYLPMVVLAGRPNVGKSTLFNRILHKRRAITDPTPGVTRDPVIADTLIAGKPARLVDTGGFKLDRERPSRAPGEDLDDLVVRRTLEMINQAALIVLILEAGEPVAEDEEFIELLRPYQDRLILAVNKTEGGRREQESWNLLRYGFPELFMISAEHGDHVEDLEAAIGSRLERVSLEPAPELERPIRVALLGKPNTGKSTLSNRLTASEASIVSPVPGTTRDVVEGVFCYKNRRFHILDTAGIRRKSKVTENIEYYSVNRAIKSIDEADVVILLIDAQEGLSDQDKKIAALAHEKGRGIILGLNKWDAMPNLSGARRTASDRIHFCFGQMEFAPIIPVSALNGLGIGELLDTAVRLYRQLTRRVETGPLNQALQQWLEEYPPPAGKQTRFKVRYAVQVSDNPVKFIFFVSRPQAVGEAYIAYIRNRIRRDLGFSSIPILLELRASSKRKAP
jgi:GTP-binding protein